MKPYYTVTEVAQRECVSTRRIRLLCELGRVFCAEKVGGQWLIQLNYRIQRLPVGRPRKKPVNRHPLHSASKR